MQVVLILIGVVLGPLYVGYARFFSGSPVSTRELIDHSDRGASAAPVPVMLGLGPAMNPVRISVEVTREGAPPDDHRVSYAARMTLHHRRIWQRVVTFDLGSGSGTHHDKVRLATLSVPAAGHYRLDIVPLGSADVALASMALYVRRNVMVPDPRIYGAGLFLFFISIVWVLLADPAGDITSGRVEIPDANSSTSRPPRDD